jgi:hypothetical protein
MLELRGLKRMANIKINMEQCRVFTCRPPLYEDFMEKGKIPVRQKKDLEGDSLVKRPKGVLARGVPTHRGIRARQRGQLSSASS